MRSARGRREVIGGRRAGLRLEEVVVDDMERSDAEREPRKARLGP